MHGHVHTHICIHTCTHTQYNSDHEAQTNKQRKISIAEAQTNKQRKISIAKEEEEEDFGFLSPAVAFDPYNAVKKSHLHMISACIRH